MAAIDWAESATRLQQELRKENLELRLDLKDFRSFQAALDDICKRFSRKDASRLVREKLSPHFKHVLSFERAIGACTQNDQTVSVLWGVTQIVIDCACRFSNHLDDTFDQLSDFYKSFPMFEAYMELFPEEPALRYPLRDFYQDYSDFCLLTIKYMSKQPLAQMVKNIVHSGPMRKLKAIQARVERHKKDFEEAILLITRRRDVAKDILLSPRPRSDAGQPGSTHQRPSSEDRRNMSTTFGTNRPRENRAFVGREQLLERLHVWFTEPRTYPSEPVSCVLYGMGGIGKTQTAIKYSYVNKDEYDFIFWVTAETVPKLVGSFGSIVVKVGIEETGTIADDLTVEKAREWLEETAKRWLLVFDNVETRQSIEHCWPTSSKNKSSIIITSQQSDLRNLASHGVAVRSLDADQGATLLLKARYPDCAPPEGEAEAARDLSTEVGGLPLAIAHIGGYIAQSSYTLARFREIAKQRYPHIWMAEAPSTIRDYQKRLAIVWDFALEQLTPEAAILVDILAFLNPDEIPEAMLLAEIKQGTTWNPGTTSAEIFLLEMAHSLAQRSLVSVEQGKTGSYLTIHRSLQTGLLQKLDKNPVRRSTVFRHVFDIVRRMTPTASPIQVPNPEAWSEYNATVPHVLTLGLAFAASDPPMRGSFELAQLLYDAGFNSWERERIPDGIQMLNLAESVLDGLSHDFKDPLRADIHAIQGMLTDSAGGLQRTIGLRRRQEAVDIRRNVIKQVQRKGETPTRTQEILLQNAINDYAYCLLQSNQYADAEGLFQSCFEKYQQWGTEAEIPFEYSKYFHNMGTVRMYQGRHYESVDLVQRCVALTQAAMGGNKSTYKVLRDKYMFACVLLQAGKVQEAYDLQLKVMKDREALCGEYNELSLESYYAVGSLCEYLGDLDGARKWISLSIERAPKTKWHQMSLGRAQVHLARVLRAQNIDLELASQYEHSGQVILESLESEIPQYMKGVSDLVAVFDSLHAFSEGRFVNRNLLKIIRSQ